MYVPDILWHARLHPLVPARALSPADVTRLHRALRHVVEEGVRWGGGPGDRDVWGNEGSYADHFQVGYRMGKPCPACGTAIEEPRVDSHELHLPPLPICPEDEALLTVPSARGAIIASCPLRLVPEGGRSPPLRRSPILEDSAPHREAPPARWGEQGGTEGANAP